jgi:hypothetical protein
MAEQWPLLLIALIPAVLVFLTAFYLIRQFLQDQRSALRAERVDSGKRDDHRQLLPLRLQAYERLALFLERITPGALVFRVHKSHMTSRMLHAELLATIREELEHNVTQQIYVSDRTWQQCKRAKEETIRLINLSFEQTEETASGTALSQKIFEMASRLSHMPSQEALLVLKEEVRRLF